MRTVWRFLKNLRIELPYNSAIPLLSIHLEKALIWKDTCTIKFIVAQFTIIRQGSNVNVHNRWKDKEEVIQKHNGILLSHEEEWNTAIGSSIDGPRDYHTKWRKSKTNIIYHLYVKSKNKNTNESIYKIETDSQT